MEQAILYLFIGLALGVSFTILILKPRSNRYKRLSKTDDLTGIQNYREFSEVILTLPKDASYSLVLIDLNNFKKINDNFGYSEGDKTLKDFAQYLSSSIRNSDFLFRYKQGDEFAILLKTSVAICSTIMERIRSNMKSQDFHSKLDFAYAFEALDRDSKEVIESVETKLRKEKLL